MPPSSPSHECSVLTEKQRDLPEHDQLTECNRGTGTSPLYLCMPDSLCGQSGKVNFLIPLMSALFLLSCGNIVQIIFSLSCFNSFLSMPPFRSFCQSLTETSKNKEAPSRMLNNSSVKGPRPSCIFFIYYTSKIRSP